MTKDSPWETNTGILKKNLPTFLQLCRKILRNEYKAGMGANNDRTWPYEKDFSQSKVIALRMPRSQLQVTQNKKAHIIEG